MEFEIGSTLHGFTVESIEGLAEIDGDAIVMSHAKSGAKLLYLKNDDENKAFSIAFKTPPADSTGVFHILEHSVLCGSEKFPVKEPFVNLLKSSMQTFLNAMTFPDKTMYPVASTNDQDLMNLMDVYMDAVLNPRIYDKRAIFEQEGWHYELDAPDAPLRYNGVVFNEMKGALSDPDSVLYDALAENLFPDTAYCFESGGDPRVIPDLTYEHFLDTHRRHYRLDNSYIVLYGNMDVSRQLAFLDDNYLSKPAPAAGAPNPLAMQDPVVRMKVEKPMQTAPENASVGAGYVVGHASDRRRILKTDILLDVLMGSNEAPLKRALLESGIADDVHGYLAGEQLQPFAVIQAKGCRPDAHDRFLAIIEDTITKLVETEIPRDKLEAALSHGEFIVRERDFGIADGVALAMNSLSGWLYDDSLPIEYLRYDTEFKGIREEIEAGCFEALARELFLENDHIASVEIVPVEDPAQSEEAQKLETIKDGMGPEEVRRVMDEMEELRRLQEEPDAPEAIATLPLLSLDDITDMKHDPGYTLLESTPLPCLHHDLPTRRIDYAYHYFDLNRVAYEDLPYVAMLIRLLGKLDTAKHTADELDSLTQARLGALRFFAETYSDDDDPFTLRPKFVVGASSLEENVGYLATLPSEIWSSTDFSNTAKIKDILQQYRIGMEQGFASSGHSAAMGRVASYYLPAAVLREDLGGVNFYRFVKDLLAHFDERADALVAKLHEVAAAVFSQEGAVSSFTGTADERDRFWEAGGTLELSNTPSEQKLVIPDPVCKREAFIVPTDVCFAAKGYDRRLLDLPYTGSYQVLSRILSYDYLWSEVRVKGGAYGAGFKAERSGALQFYSYRDPNLDETLARFDAAGAWCKAFSPEEDAMRGYIISSVAGYDAPKKPREIARRQDSEYFAGLDDGWREQARREVLATDAGSIRSLAPALEGVAEKQAACVFGSRDILTSSKSGFEVIDLLGG